MEKFFVRKHDKNPKGDQENPTNDVVDASQAASSLSLQRQRLLQHDSLQPSPPPLQRIPQSSASYSLSSSVGVESDEDYPYASEASSSNIETNYMGPINSGSQYPVNDLSKGVSGQGHLLKSDAVLQQSFPDTDDSVLRSVDPAYYTKGSETSLLSSPNLNKNTPHQAEACARDADEEDVKDSKQRAQSYVEEDVNYETLIKKVVILCDGLKFGECSVILDRLSPETLHKVVPEIPMQTLLDAIPKSLGTIHTILYKLLLDGGGAGSTPRRPKRTKELLPFDDILKHTVQYLACLEDPSSQIERSESITFHYKGILKLIAQNKPQLKKTLFKKKRGIEQCLTGLGKHGPICTADDKLVVLHDALRQEFTKTVQQYKTTLQKLDEMTATTKAKRSDSGNSLSIRASHQRLLQCSQTDIEDRLIKNKTLYSAVEPIITNQFLDRLLQILEERIHCDKAILFHYTELKKLSKGAPPYSQVAAFFQRYLAAYSQVLDVFQEVLQDEKNADEESDPETHEAKSSSGQSFFTRAFSHVSGTDSADGDMNFRASCSVIPAMEVSKEVINLREEVQKVREELRQAKEAVAELEGREKALKERLVAGAQKSVESSPRFEDLNLGENRPTQLIHRYGNLYSQIRVDAFDALDRLRELADFDELKGKLLFSVIVLSFRSVQEKLDEVKKKLFSILQLPKPEDCRRSSDTISRDMDGHVCLYLKRTVDRFDLSDVIEVVSRQLWQTLYDYPSLKNCRELHTYITECARLSWALSVQNPPYIINYEAETFNANLHMRFFTSNPESSVIKTLIWPSLLEGENGPCVYKGVVIT